MDLWGLERRMKIGLVNVWLELIGGGLVLEMGRGMGCGNGGWYRGGVREEGKGDGLG